MIPGFDNLSMGWCDVVERVGLTVAVVVVPYSDRLWQSPGFETEIGAVLRKEHLGDLDSVIWQDPVYAFFYLKSKTLNRGLEAIKSGLAGAQLLDGCKIGLCDSADDLWRQVYPQIDQTT